MTERLEAAYYRHPRLLPIFFGPFFMVPCLKGELTFVPFAISKTSLKKQKPPASRLRPARGFRFESTV